MSNRTRRFLHRLGGSSVGQRLPSEWKRSVVSLVKRIGGDGVLQGAGRRPQRERPLGLRVGVAGPDAEPFAVGSVERIALTADALAEATYLDVAVASELDEDLSEAVDGLRAVRLDPGEVLPPLGPGFTPRGFDKRPVERFLRLVETPAEPVDGPTAGVLSPSDTRPDHRLPAGRELATRTVGSLPHPIGQTDKWLATVQPHIALLDDRASWSDHRARAMTLVRAAAVGLPVVLDRTIDEDPIREFLPSPVLDCFASVDVRDLLDPLERSRIAHRQWQQVHRHFGARARWDHLLTSRGRVGMPRPSVSVVVATRRPDLIDHWAAQLARQRDVDFEVVAALHGSPFTPADHVRAVSILGDRVRVRSTPDRATLGELLDLATQTADGDLIVKWDDDDYYDIEHLADLVCSWEYTGATLVGKACDFVHLEGTDVTMRREQGPRETYSTTIAGPTLCIARHDLAAIGGWRRAARQVDSLLIAAVLANGGRVYRAAGFGFVLRRAAQHGHGHTWSVPDQEFLSQASAQRRGLDLGFAGVRT